MNTNVPLSANLDKNENAFNVLFESSPLPMFIFDVETLAFIVVNKSATALYGYSTEEFQQITIVDIRPLEDVAYLMASLKTHTSELRDIGTVRHKKRMVQFFKLFCTHTMLIGKTEAPAT